MAKQLFANNASSLLAASIDDNDLTIQVDVGDGALFPNPGAGEFFIVGLVNAAGDYEIVRCSSRTSDIITIATGGRGQEGTVAQSWTNGLTRVELRNSKGTMDRFLQREGDTMSGDLDMDGNDIVDPSLVGDWKGTNGQLVGTALRGTEDDASNEVKVPTGGGQATAGGSAILTEARVNQVRTAAFSVGMIMDWYGAAVNCPNGWAICDGSNGTPDMRDKVTVGVSGTKALGSTGGAEAASGSTSSAGDHDHGGATGGTALTAAQNGPHGHAIRALNNGGTFSEVDAFNRSGFPHGSVPSASGVGGDPGGYVTNNGDGNPIIQASGSGDPHTHPIAASGNHSHTLSGVSVMQPYRALHKIMFTGVFV